MTNEFNSYCRMYYSFYMVAVLLCLWCIQGQSKLTDHHGSNLEGGMLYPRVSERRTVQDLGGLWKFRADTSSSRIAGFQEKWYFNPLSKSGSVIDMPVPSSFNDITQDDNLRQFIGWVWYDREFFIPFPMVQKDVRYVLRVESAHYNAIVWVNGQMVMNHTGGHLPFEADVSSILQITDKTYRVTIAVNNTLSPTTLPPGELIYDSDLTNPWIQTYQFDFYNYAGIHRPVKLYTTPTSYIDDITVWTSFSGTTGYVHYVVSVVGSYKDVKVTLLDRNNSFVVASPSLKGNLTISNVQLWWPYTMSSNPAYLYTLQVSTSLDVYRLPVGIRTVKWTESAFFINDKSFYFHGVNKHEDSDIRGKGLDLPLIVKNLNLLKWLNANSFRTSHYPYAEEIMDLCDEHGIVIIDESPGVGIVKASFMTNESITHHKNVMFELYRRDKNRPSVVMWSIANEPNSHIPEAEKYFKNIFDYTRSLDDKRPLTFAHSGQFSPSEDYVASFADVLCMNAYFGWYETPGIVDCINPKLSAYLKEWNKYYNKPLILSEYGAGAVAGFHTDPALMYTEYYQVDLFKEHFKVFDELRSCFLIGELVWNFADFMTKQATTRALGNRKGIFTRQRQPKAVAHVLRDRYTHIPVNYSYTTYL